MNDLSPRTKAALAVYRDTPTVDDAARDRMWSRLEASVGGAAEPEFAPVVRLDVGRTALRMGIALAAAAAILLLLRSIDWQSVMGSEDEDPRSQAVYGAADEPSGGLAKTRAEPATPKPPAPVSAQAPSAPAAAVEVEPPASDAVAPEIESAPKRVASPRPARTTSPSEPEPAPVDTLSEEMRLMARVKAALSAGNADKALAVLDSHARQHPHGQMAEDRAALRPQALCAAGRNADAAAAARRFLKAHSDSAHRARVQTVAKAAAEKKCPTS